MVSLKLLNSKTLIRHTNNQMNESISICFKVTLKHFLIVLEFLSEKLSKKKVETKRKTEFGHCNKRRFMKKKKKKKTKYKRDGVEDTTITQNYFYIITIYNNYNK